MKRKTLAETFRSHWKENADGCWIWQRAVGSHGYGVLQVNGALELAHRFSYEKTYGKLPAGYYACHKCDVKKCVRPTHLFAGTCKDNHQDALKKGRGRRGIHRGEDNVTSKLREADVLEIRKRLAAGEFQTQIAKDYKVHKTNVQCIAARKTWKHLL